MISKSNNVEIIDSRSKFSIYFYCGVLISILIIITILTILILFVAPSVIINFILIDLVFFLIIIPFIYIMISRYLPKRSIIISDKGISFFRPKKDPITINWSDFDIITIGLRGKRATAEILLLILKFFLKKPSLTIVKKINYTFFHIERIYDFLDSLSKYLKKNNKQINIDEKTRTIFKNLIEPYLR